MAKRAYLDTHIIVWLYAAKLELLSEKAKVAIETYDLYFSSIVDLELTYLSEIKRVTVQSEKILSNLADSIGLKRCDHDFSSIITKSKDIKWTRDPFDRIIVGNAAIGKNFLVSKDSLINKNYKYSCW